MVVLHILRQHQPEIPVIFLDTGYHFAETYAYRDRMVQEWSIQLINVLPELTVAQHEAKSGLQYLVEPTQCCATRKVQPLLRSLEPFDLWFTGLRRELIAHARQSERRWKNIIYRLGKNSGS